MQEIQDILASYFCVCAPLIYILCCYSSPLNFINCLFFSITFFKILSLILGICFHPQPTFLFLGLLFLVNYLWLFLTYLLQGKRFIIILETNRCLVEIANSERITEWFGLNINDQHSANRLSRFKAKYIR